MSRRGVIGSSVLAAPVILITIVVLTAFIVVVNMTITLKGYGESSSAFRVSFQDHDSRIFGELLSEESVILNDGSGRAPTVEHYRSSSYTTNPVAFHEGLVTIVNIYFDLQDQLPVQERQALFLPIEQLIASRYGCEGENRVKVFAFPRRVGLGSSPGMMLMYDYPARQWVQGGEGLPVFESMHSMESTTEFLERYREEGYYIEELNSGVYLLVRGSLVC